jgi:phosphoribosylaminoimidazolecarboxamide formyltransferase/IMP cyclohydrolase
MNRIQRALISVSDKTGLVEFAAQLRALGVAIISTGGTARSLKDADIAVTELSQFTGFPEMLDGRLKTLHPNVHGGLLYLRDNPEHQRQIAAHGIQPIDLLVVNLYPFEQTIARPGVAVHDAIEQIDIGGPSMLRSAAKNHASVTVVVDPADYEAVLNDIREHNGNTCPMFRWSLAVKVFETTARYDAAIARYLHAERLKHKGEPPPLFPAELRLAMTKAQDLRYGENPHQQAALYGEFHNHFRQLHGKELSYNNILDLTAAAELAAEFDDPTVAIIKHTNPCGVGSAPTLPEAWELAYATDRQAPFGGIIAVNRPLDGAIAEAIAEIFSEVIVAPEFTPDALAILQKKKNLRLIRVSDGSDGTPYQLRSVTGGLLVQQPDARLVSAADMKVVTQREPTKSERHAMLFAWRVVKHVKSNAIVFASADANITRTLGIGAGQMSRVDSSRIAIWKAGQAGLDLAGSVVASDAFFPFPDAVLAAAEAGATAVIQPGGSLRDADIIAAANQRNLAMIFTGIRHFRH